MQESVSQAFIHQVTPSAETADGSALVLLHGTGGTETDLIPLGFRVAPRATLIGVRGRSLAEGSPRWFRRLSMAQFDQAHVRSEAEAFAAFLPDVLAQHHLSLEHSTFLGYSNGANFIAAVMLLHPHLIRRAILLRPMLVLDEPPNADLSDAQVLLVTGITDPYREYVPPLDRTLRQRGAHVIKHTVAAGHELSRNDVRIVQLWLRDIVTTPPLPA